MLTAFQRTLLSAVSWYSNYVPLERGKSPLQQLAIRALGPTELTAISEDGDRFLLRFPEDHNWEDLYFRGVFETGTSRLFKQILRPDDVVFDIGANLGWYTVLFARFLTRGLCHAFEPQPIMFERLQQNCELNRLGANLTLNPVALGQKEGTAELFSFRNLGAGQASLSSLGREDYSVVSVPLTTLDRYLDTTGISKVDVIKMDVEGAEMSVFKGAQSIFRLRHPPIWLLEMNRETASNFGYAPEDLLGFLERHGRWNFFRVVLGWGETLPMKSLTDYEHGDNVLCVPESRPDRIRSMFG